ncbi:MAG: PilZ domain-containing protein [Desulfocapsaceae bacterium]
MQYQRLHIRVPVAGDATLKVGDHVRIAASVINISAGGICITAPSHVLGDTEYHIEIITEAEGKIRFSGFPVYQTDSSVGIKITSIGREDLKAIYRLVEGFQLTEEFIKHIDKHDILKDWLVDEAGNDLSVTFDTGSTKNK